MSRRPLGLIALTGASLLVAASACAALADTLIGPKILEDNLARPTQLGIVKGE